MQLTFREKGLKKETRRKIMVLVITFFLALAFFYIWINRSKVEDVGTDLTGGNGQYFRHIA